MSTSNANESFEPTMTISIYGGKKSDVKESIERNLEVADESFYQTWLSINVMKQLAFLFEGGVESSGGIIEMIVMFVFVALILAAFAFWQVVIFMIVLLVLALFSGGTSFKFVRGTFIEADHTKIDLTKLDNFVKEQILAGRFVKVESTAVKDQLNKVTRDASRATTFFRRGIYLAMIVATLLLVIEIVYYFFMGHWLSGLNPATGPQEIIVLFCFGFIFLLGILIMDLGVLMRRSLSKSLSSS